MRGTALLAGAALAAVVASAAQAHGYYYRPHWGYYGSGVGVYFGSPWYWGAPWSGYGYPYAYPYAYSYAYPYAYSYPYAYPYPRGYAPSDAVAAPGAYVERAPRTEPGGSWYYCSDPPGYYPHVSLCRRPWTAVAPFPVEGSAVKPRAPQ